MNRLGILLATAWIGVIAAGDQDQSVDLSGTWNLVSELPTSPAPAGPGRTLTLFIKQRPNEIQVDRLVTAGPRTMYLAISLKLDGSESVNSWGRTSSDVVRTRASWKGGKLQMVSETSKTAWKEVFYKDKDQLVAEEIQDDGKITQMRYSFVRKSP